MENTNFLIIKQKNFWRKFDQSQKKKYQISMKNFKEIRFQLNVKTFLLKKPNKPKRYMNKYDQRIYITK